MITEASQLHMLPAVCVDQLLHYIITGESMLSAEKTENYHRVLNTEKKL